MKNQEQDQYIAALKKDGEFVIEKFNSFIGNKSEQQKFLEQILDEGQVHFEHAADIACGSGALSYWLSLKYPNSSYTLVDLNDDLIEEARKVNTGDRFHFHVQNVYDLSLLQDNDYDLTCCWQTLLCLENPQKALDELIRITRKGGRIYISSLFDPVNEVDIYAKMVDWTRVSAQDGHYTPYNTFSMKTIHRWLDGKVETIKLHPFQIQIDLPDVYKGLGTYTVRLENGDRLQFSAGLHLNWGILELVK
ncbi:class I SAM-dependent methyltransferase [Paenibacillus rigui]|uniref:Methyltransferase domain-containing protein n=1 Tax=Paenibacillus rigui TaxID=554312 RepID=A0A229UJH5_9BACL|nr:class I SAM-dependent methyltransferase [Paenibacillus rigui]OXM83049.1 hypothetical protein CF651_27945 [Paenibacillus rigui]